MVPGLVWQERLERVPTGENGTFPVEIRVFYGGRGPYLTQLDPSRLNLLVRVTRASPQFFLSYQRSERRLCALQKWLIPPTALLERWLMDFILSHCTFHSVGQAKNSDIRFSRYSEFSISNLCTSRLGPGVKKNRVYKLQCGARRF